jgi:hypothetical protein
MTIFSEERVTIKKLRTDLPDWAWTAEHYGMGYRYIGVKGDRTVTVHACSVLSGPCEDDYATRWYAYDGKVSQSFSMFHMTNISQVPV